MAKSERGMVTVAKVGESEGIAQSVLRRQMPNADRKGVSKTFEASGEYRVIFDLDPEPEKPLRVNLDLDQLEEFKE